MTKTLFLITLIFSFWNCNSSSIKKDNKNGKEKFKALNIIISPVENSTLMKVEKKGEFIIHLPANNDWEFLADDEHYIFTASSKSFGFDVFYSRDNSIKNIIEQEKYLASIGQLYTNRGLKLENSQMTIVSPTENRVMSFSNSLLEGHFITWFFITVRQGKNNEVYKLDIRKMNPPPEHFKELRIALNNLLANGFLILQE